MQSQLRGRVCNKVLHVPDLEAADTALREALRELQDIVIFDEVVAFREYLLDPDDDRSEKSEILIDTGTIQGYLTRFNDLFQNHAIDLVDIDLPLDAAGD